MFFRYWTRRSRKLIAVLLASAPLAGLTAGTDDVAVYVPKQAPRTAVLNGRHETFKTYCLNGEGAKAFAKIKAGASLIQTKSCIGRGSASRLLF